MSINDQDIDLTLNKKFAEIPEWQRNKHANMTYNKVSTGKYRGKVALHEYLVSEIDKLPWRRKMNEINSLQRQQVFKEDYLSTEAGCIVRTTSSNTLLFFGENRIQNPEVQEELFLEVIGYIPYSSVHRCWHCGSLFISPMKEFPLRCHNCADDDGIPWERRVR